MYFVSLYLDCWSLSERNLFKKHILFLAAGVPYTFITTRHSTTALTRVVHSLPHVTHFRDSLHSRRARVPPRPEEKRLLGVSSALGGWGKQSLTERMSDSACYAA